VAEIVKFPHDDFSFEALDFHGKSISRKYQQNAMYLEACQQILSMTPEKLKAKFRTREFKKIPFDDLVEDFENVAKDCDAVIKFLTMARARLIAVRAKLV